MSDCERSELYEDLSELAALTGTGRRRQWSHWLAREIDVRAGNHDAVITHHVAFHAYQWQLTAHRVSQGRQSSRGPRPNAMWSQLCSSISIFRSGDSGGVARHVRTAINTRAGFGRDVDWPGELA